MIGVNPYHLLLCGIMCTPYMRVGGWRIERQVADRLNGRRLGNTGQSTPDVVSCCGGYIVLGEVKHRRRLPDWLKNALIQAECHVEDDQLAIAVLHELHMPVGDSLVVLRLDDFCRWLVDL